ADKNLSAAEASSNIKSGSKKKSATSSSGSSSSKSSNPASPTPPSSSSTAHKSSPGPCGGAQATISNGNVICDLTISESILPVEVRLLAPSGSPGIKVDCSADEACTDSQYGQPVTYFKTKTYSQGFSVNVVK